MTRIIRYVMRKKKRTLTRKDMKRKEKRTRKNRMKEKEMCTIVMLNSYLALIDLRDKKRLKVQYNNNINAIFLL